MFVKKRALLLSLIFFFIAAFRGEADISVNLNAGQLTAANMVSMLIDDNSPSTNGSLLLLVDLGSSNTLDNTLSPGQYVSGTNTILAAGGFNDNGGTNETLTAFTITGTPQVGDLVALRWFPEITFAQYVAGVLPVSGSYFGTYNPSGGNPDGGSQWVVPSNGSAIDLNFFTSNSDSGGSQPPGSGIASLQVAQPNSVSFSSWQSIYFSTQQLNDAAVSGATATPQNDGVPNLLKYFYDINPTRPMTTADRAALPQVSTTLNGGVEYLTLIYQQNSGLTGVMVSAQNSSDLQTWSPVTSQQIGTNATTGDYIMEAQVAVTGAKQFLRLQVTSP